MTAAPDPWMALKRFTAARIALGRAGHAVPTPALLQFGLAHARAKDAVHHPFEPERLAAQLEAEGWPHLVVRSRVADRSEYLRRPDLGRRLDAGSRSLVEQSAAVQGPDLVFVLADGLSAQAVERHALPLLREVVPRLNGWRLGPLVMAEQARVALGDEIGALLGAEQVVMLIGERPGLSSPDSLGVYLTYRPRVGRSDAERNCISNVRPEGLCYGEAARRLAYLLDASRQLKLSGVGLKDESDSVPVLEDSDSAPVLEASAGPALLREEE